MCIVPEDWFRCHTWMGFESKLTHPAVVHEAAE